MNNSNNIFKLIFQSRSTNEAFARTAVAAFIAGLDPTIEELTDIKTAVSEAVTNCIVHAYKTEPGLSRLRQSLSSAKTLTVSLRTRLRHKDIAKAQCFLHNNRQGFRTRRTWFSVMEAFMDKVKVHSTVGKGTTVTMKKHISEKTKNAYVSECKPDEFIESNSACTFCANRFKGRVLNTTTCSKQPALD